MLSLTNWLTKLVSYYTFGWVGMVSAGIGIYNALSSDSGGGAGSTQPGQASVADPFGGQRPQYQQQLQQLMNNPSSIQGSPGYQWQMAQGLEGVNRTEAARGMLGSGNRLAELMKYGQGMASTEYGNQFSRLAQLSGANIGSPGTAAQLGQQNQYANQQGLMQGIGQVGTVLNNPNSGLNTWMGGSSGFNTGTGGSGYIVGGEQGAMLSAQW